MGRILLRVSGILFILTGGVTAFSGWYTTYGLYSTAFGGLSIPALLKAFTIAIGLCAGGGFALLIGQERTQRHWLGWLGIVLTLLGLAASTIAIAAFYTDGDGQGSNSRFFITAYLVAVPLYAVGLIFWSLDLPNTTTSLLLQKGAMSLIGVVPFFASSLLRLSPLALTSERFYLIEALINGGLWCLLGGSLWFYHAPLAHSPVESRSRSFADSSFDLVVSPIPPAET
jgi:hypothetical protein